MKRIVMIALLGMLAMVFSDTGQVNAEKAKSGTPALQAAGTLAEYNSSTAAAPAFSAFALHERQVAASAATIAVKKTPMMADVTQKARMPHFRQLQFREIVSGKSPLS